MHVDRPAASPKLVRTRPARPCAATALIPLTMIACLTGPVGARAECRTPIERSSLSDFAQRPARFIDRFPSGGDDLALSIRNFAAFNREGLRAIKAAIRRANLSQKQAIGTGMAMAVVACLARDGEVAREIADVVKGSDDPDVTDAYLAASDDGTGTVPASASKPADEGQVKGFKPGQSLDIPTTVVPKLVPDIEKVP